MQVNMIFGFLGSGKTTLVRHLLGARARERKLAVIVNEFGQVGIDGAILEGEAVDMIQLTSGCLCCTLKGPLLSAIEELRDKAGIEHVVIEASGVADPEEMIESFSAPEFRASVAIGPFVTVVDTAKFAVMREMLGEFYGSQVAHADIVLLNKTDLASPEQLEAVRAEVAELNPGARIVTTEHCDVDAGLVLDALSGWEPGPGEHGHHHHHDHPDFESEVLDAAGPVTRAALESFFAGLPPEVLRAKGFMVVDGAASLVQFTAGQLEITPATLDRVRQMVFIGRDLDRDGLAARFAFAGVAPEDGTR
ncbi:MAG: GTP-binding protein [Proteobacteria bacterium]|nr:GTP-binding protein [Pseudomonadota bacterium]